VAENGEYINCEPESAQALFFWNSSTLYQKGTGLVIGCPQWIARERVKKGGEEFLRGLKRRNQDE
jgi:hypothetical protein